MQGCQTGNPGSYAERRRSRLLLIILLVVLFGGGGGYYGYIPEGGAAGAWGSSGRSCSGGWSCTCLAG